MRVLANEKVFSRWPDVVVQFEDFESVKAVPLLEKYRDKYRCFNDDIQVSLNARSLHWCFALSRSLFLGHAALRLHIVAHSR